MGSKDFTATERFFVLIGREPWSITVDNGRTIRIIMGLGRVDGKFSSHINFFSWTFPFAWIFFRPVREYFLGVLGPHEFFHKIFPGTNIFLWCFTNPPPPLITFLMVRRHGNYVTVAQFVFLFLLRAICGELFNEWTSKTLNVIVQDESTINFHGPYSYRSQKWRENLQKLAVKSFAWWSWYHFSADHENFFRFV